ncbi:NAD(P)H-quinone oxidoreductase [Alteromonas sediminis]|uniref:NAD(P)H-quinone oxidoreductase n=1 Tax=Alteromonas sediminis TaxID=2259342 RepID=UPI0014052A12|nr:NAD(P)H-quinone oxidoreductase [Alteromonas sediminis]
MHYIDNNLKVVKTHPPTHAAHQVLIAVEAFGVNRADILQRQGKYPPPQGESEILGLEVAGEVIGCGPSVTRWKLGDRVCGLVAGGGYAQKVVVNEQHLMALPDSLTMSAAAGLSEVFLTAYQALFTIANIQAGERVLIHAGASGVGLAAIQLAKLHQCDVAVTVSSEKKGAVCKAYGANLIVNYQQQDFVNEIKSKWQHGVDVVVDVVGGDYIPRNMNVLNMDGRIVCLSMLGGRMVEQFDLARLLAKRITLFGSTLRNRSQQYKAKLTREFEALYMKKFASGELKVPLDAVFKAEQVADAHAKLEANDSVGKLVCYWDDK